MDYIKDGTLEELIQKKKLEKEKNYFTEEEISKIMQGILSGVKEMHDN